MHVLPVWKMQERVCTAPSLLRHNHTESYPRDDCRFPHILPDGTTQQHTTNHVPGRGGHRPRPSIHTNGVAGLEEKFATLTTQDVSNFPLPQGRNVLTSRISRPSGHGRTRNQAQSMALTAAAPATAPVARSPPSPGRAGGDFRATRTTSTRMATARTKSPSHR